MLYAVAGVALAAAANDADSSGIVSAVHIDYVAPAQVGEVLTATALGIERTAREDFSRSGWSVPPTVRWWPGRMAARPGEPDDPPQDARHARRGVVCPSAAAAPRWEAS